MSHHAAIAGALDAAARDAAAIGQFSAASPFPIDEPRQDGPDGRG